MGKENVKCGMCVYVCLCVYTQRFCNGVSFGHEEEQNCVSYEEMDVMDHHILQNNPDSQKTYQDFFSNEQLKKIKRKPRRLSLVRT